MLFLHPAFGDCGVWDAQWQTFAPTFSLVRCDLPGFGRTPIEQPTVTLAGEVADLLDGLELGACAVVGNSLGGRVALELTVGRPELVRALVLVGTLLPGGREPSAALEVYNEALRRALEAADLEQAVEMSVAMWLADDADASLRERAGGMQRRAFELQLPWGDDLAEEHLVPAVQERLHDVGVPTLVVVGDQDVEDVRRYARMLTSAIPGAECAVIEGAAHVPSLERPREFDAVVLPFLERILSS